MSRGDSYLLNFYLLFWGCFFCFVLFLVGGEGDRGRVGIVVWGARMKGRGGCGAVKHQRSGQE